MKSFMPKNGSIPRFKISVNDGVNTHMTMLSAQLANMAGDLKEGTIISAGEMITNDVNGKL